MALATWQQVATALGRPATDFTTPQQEQITWWLGGVERLIRKRFGSLDGLEAEDVIYVEVEVVADKVRIHELETKETSRTVSADDGSVTRRFEHTPVTDGDVTDDWWDLLTPDGTSGAFTINPFGNRWRDRRRCL